MTPTTSTRVLLSVLIPTLRSRQQSFAALTAKLQGQIAASDLHDQVEIVHFRDDREHSVGAKRNWLLDNARGEFVVFVDDDDDVSDQYVPLICRTLREHPEIDCVGITGTILFRGSHARTFVHSLRYKGYRHVKGTYLRPPLHLNPMRRDIAKRYRFPDINYSEDIDWGMRICRDGVLAREYFLSEVLYYYRSRRPWWYQWLLDRTETIRHALGMQLANRVRIQRWLRNRTGVGLEHNAR
jgi:glycosyltransferase involved in cell wall biosynthesis